jgi:Nif-specific regulatory protein
MTKTRQPIALTETDMALLRELTASIRRYGNLDEMLQAVLARIREVLGIEGASVALHDAPRGEFYFIHTVEEAGGGDARQHPPMRFPDHYGVAGWVFRHNRSVVIPDAARDPRFANTLDLQRRLATRSMICVPLNTPQERIGVLYALNKLTGTFDRREAALLEVLAGPLAASIENARFLGELRQQADTLERENQRLRAEVQERFSRQGLIGSSRAMEGVFALLDKIVDTDTSVLIQGETGTGKEMIARCIHYSGPLRARPFVAENCGALSENLLESELFGHVKGAFTGAVADKKGLFEMADGGTVFLDEIADMPAAMQIKLLRVLQEGQVRPVGGSRIIDVAFRLIVSSNRDLFEEVRKGRFRDDLFYRIQVFPLELPPLRQRREDIPLLATHFLEDCARRFGRPLPRFSPAAMERLTRHDWPGNVRELKNEIERALCLAGREEEIGVACLSGKIAGGREGAAPEEEETTHLATAVERLERSLITRALQRTRGNRSQAARLLGLTRQGLLNKINRYAIDG